MIKTFSPEDQPRLLKEAGSLTQLLTKDHNQVKSASAVINKKILEEHWPDDNHFGQHLIALGSEEDFGENRNGDAWSRAALQKYGHTFMDGAMFREHLNRCARTQGIGIIKFAAYNPEMHRMELIVHGDKRKAESEFEMAKAGKALAYSMSCFPAGTMVTRPDGTRTPIEEIKEGDMVLSHKGRACRVSALQSRDYVGKLVRIRAWGVHEELVATEEHPLWARVALRADAPCPVCGEKFKSLKAHLWQKKDAQHVAASRDYSRNTEGFWPAHYLGTRDSLRTAIPQESNDEGSVDLAKVAGYYLSEGSLTTVKQRYARTNGDKAEVECLRTEWTFGPGELHMATEVADCVERLGHSRPGVFVEPKHNRIKVCSHSRSLHAWLLEHCGKYSYGKQLSAQLMGWKPEFQKWLLGRWLDGDGSWCRTNHIISGVTVSETMATQLLLLAGRCGVVGSLTTGAGRKDVMFKEGRKSNTRRSYILRFHLSDDIVALKNFMSKIPRDFAPRPKTYEKSMDGMRFQGEGKTVTMTLKESMVVAEGGFLYRRIRTAKEEFAAVTVYDLTVEGDHGFHANNVGVSNCRLPKDNCSICNHAARHRGEYCTHLKNHLTRYIPEFRKYAYARNEDQVKFFDISSVKNPADRIAHFLSYQFSDDPMAKAAAAEYIMGGSELAEMYGQRDVIFFTPWEDATLRKLAAAEDAFNDLPFHRRHALNMAVPRPLSEDNMGRLREVPPHAALGELAKRASVLDFIGFTSLITGESRADLEKDACCAGAMQQLPGVFNEMLSAGGSNCPPELASATSPDSYGCSLAPQKDAIDNMLSAVGEDLGLTSGPSQYRAMEQTVAKQASVSRIAPAAPDFKFQALRMAYGHYVVKAAHQIISAAPSDTRLLADILVAQNLGLVEQSACA